MPDQRLVRDLRRATAAGIPSNDKTGFGARKGLDYCVRSRIGRESNPRARFLAPIARRDHAHEQTPGSSLFNWLQTVKKLVRPLFEGLLEPGIIAKAYLQALPLLPSLLQRVFEKRQL